jgi:hypothetical protein
VGFFVKQQVEVWQAMKQSLCLLEGISRIGGRIIVAQIGTSSSKKGRTIQKIFVFLESRESLKPCHSYILEVLSKLISFH